MGYDELHWVINKMKEGGFKSWMCEKAWFATLYHLPLFTDGLRKQGVIMRLIYWSLLGIMSLCGEIRSGATSNYTTLLTTRHMGELWTNLCNWVWYQNFLLCEMLVVDQEKELKNKMLSRFFFLFLFFGG